jgi:hypothetical protein
MRSLDLTGLKAHHPLGFLAACGLLRCVTESNAFGWSKLGWKSSEGGSSFAAIDCERPLDISSVTQTLLARSKEQRESPAWTWSTKVDDRNEYRNMGRRTVREVFKGGSRNAADMLAALASDLVADGELLRPTSFDLTSGNQRLLQSFRSLAAKPDFTRAAVEEALVGPWMYKDDYHSLGWDPQVQRLHALRGKLPEKDKENRSVRVAVFLASQAIPLFPCFALGDRLRTTGFHRYDEDEWFAWPIWRDPISLHALRSLLAHPLTSDLRERGVEVVYHCRRTHTGGSEGNYQIFSYPEEWPWTNG